MRTIANDLSKSITTAIDMLGGGLNGRVDAITEGLHNQTERLTQMIDSNRGTLVEAIGAKSAEISNVISSATESALKTIEGHGGAFTVAMMNNSSDLARQINTASDVAIGAVNKSLKDIEESSKAAIDQSRQVATTTVNELQETSKILRTDTLALFEQLREGNILLQEVLTGAHDNLNNLERTLVTRVADFATTMNDLNTRNGSNTTALEEQLGLFNSRTPSALANLGSLAIQFDSHGRALAEAAELIEISNSRTSQSVIDLNAQFESLINTFDTRALDMDEQLNRFTTLLDQSLDAAEMRAHEITQAVAEGAGDVSAAVSHQLQGVRLAVEDERRQTVEAMSEIYHQGTREADMMFRQSADKFASIVHS
ncbi:MAG: methyl-accepting chemotaxis protein, partial [Afipia sp.]|nr:methyl-accepting chemotaxis protein [Afipia sp.]